ncbi:MAG TPA: aminotransferase class IV [Bryobacteraceae bacterium]
MHRFLLHNGALRENKEALLSPGQVGFLNGWGVFSTLRVSEGVLFAFDRHYARLRRDAALLHVPFTLSAAELEKSLLTLVDANHVADATLRVAIVRNKGGLFESPALTRDADLIAFTADLSAWGAGVNLSYVANGRFAASPFSGVKYTSWAENLTWYEQAHQNGFDEVILLNERGQVSECTSANIFAIKDGRVLTPPLASGCLPGVTRAILLEEIRLAGLAIFERELTPADLDESDQVFVTSTTRDLLPVFSVDRRPLRQDRQRLASLQRAFLDFRAAYTADRKVALTR